MPTPLDDGAIVDRGQPVTLVVLFEETPEEVYVSYLEPGKQKPFVDDGYGQPTSKIEHLDNNAFRYRIVTKDFRPGTCWWHIWSVIGGETAESKYGSFVIKSSPPQLL